VHEVQTVVGGFADCVDEQVTGSPSVFFLLQTPQDASKLQVPSNIVVPGYPGLSFQIGSSFDFKLNAFAFLNAAREYKEKESQERCSGSGRKKSFLKLKGNAVRGRGLKVLVEVETETIQKMERENGRGRKQKYHENGTRELTYLNSCRYLS
jgi:hypothetical protein